MAALSKGAFLVPETGNGARHLYICFRMNWFLCCKYLTIHHSIPTKVSTRFPADSISHGQEGPTPSFPEPSLNKYRPSSGEFSLRKNKSWENNGIWKVYFPLDWGKEAMGTKLASKDNGWNGESYGWP